MKHSKHKQQGLTLVELMVALILGMLVMAGVIQLFIANKETYRAQDGLAQVQEAGRFAVYLLRTDFAGAGNLGCAGPRTEPGQGQETRIGAVAHNIPGELQPSSSGKYSTMAGMNDVDGSSITLPSGTAITPVAGTDIINVRGISSTAGIRYVSGPMADNTDDIDLGAGNLSIIKGELLYIGACTYGDIFRASNDVAASSAGPLEHGLTVTEANGDLTDVNTSTALSDRYGADALIGKLRSNWYYVKQETREFDGQPVLALHRVDVAGRDSELIAGVENMQILYGVDTDTVQDFIADRYLTAAQVTDWETVVSARINLLVNSVSRAAREAVIYDYSPVGNDQTPADSDDYRLRREFSFVATLRNHTR